jgi:hypothetical protein
MTKEYKKWLAKLDFISTEYPFGKIETHRNEEGNFHDKGERPAQISPTRITQWQNGRKHGIDVDIYGSLVYWFKGVLVPMKYMTRPEELTFEEIIGHPNAEVRRVGIEIYGFDRLISEKKFKAVHKDNKTGASLYSLKMGKGDREQNVCIVRVLDGTPMPDGERKVYFLQVPPTMKTCKEAIAWTFRKDEASYAPEVET